MRTLHWIPVTASVLLIGVAAAQDTSRTDARDDGFNGPVKSVLTTTAYHDIGWRQPDGVGLVLPIFCQECYYDPTGAKIRSGQRSADGFQGNNILLIRDPEGRVTERRMLDASTGALRTHEVLGPYGLTEQTFYERGKLSSSRTTRYDQFGHITETSTVDGSGQQTEHGHSTYTEEGVLIEDSTWGANGQLKYQQRNDPERHIETFRTFDESGQVKLAWTTKDDKIVSFWELSDEPNQYGGCMENGVDKTGLRETHCYANGNQVRAVIREQFTEPTSHLPDHIEWLDGTGKLLYASYYDYITDGHRNWTRRRIRVISPEHPERTLLEEDNRILVYW